MRTKSRHFTWIAATAAIQILCGCSSLAAIGGGGVSTQSTGVNSNGDATPRIVLAEPGSPNPEQLITRSFSASVSGNSDSSSPFVTCSRANVVLDEPLVEIDVRQSVNARLQIGGADGEPISGLGFIVVNEAGQFICTDSGPWFISYMDQAFDPGVYRIYPAQALPNYESDQVPAFTRDQIAQGEYSFKVWTTEQVGPVPTLRLDAEENPTLHKTLSYKGATVPSSFMDIDSACDHLEAPLISAAPIAQVEITNDAHELVYWGPEVAGFTLVGEGTRHCYVGNRFTVHASAGTYEIYPFAHSSMTDQNFDIWLYDGKRELTHNPMTLLAEGGQEVTFTPGGDQLVVHSPPIPQAGRTVSAQCGLSSDFTGPAPTFDFPVQPSLRLTLESPTRLEIDYFSEGNNLAAHQIVSADGEGDCHPLSSTDTRPLGWDRLSDRALPPGEYIIRFGFVEDVEWSDMTIAIREKGTRVDPTAAIREAPADLAYSDRIINRYVPLLNTGWSSSERLSRLFFELNPSLQVFVKYDLNEDSARPLFVSDDAAHDAMEGVDYPKKDEPVLLGRDRSGTFIISADGLKYRLLMDATAAEPEGEPVFPETPRYLELHLDDFAEYGSEAIRAEIATHQERAEEAERCWYRYVEDRGGFTDPDVTLYLVTYVNGEVVNVENWGSRVGEEGSRACGLDRLQVAEAQLMRRLSAGYVDRAEARLAEIAEKGR